MKMDEFKKVVLQDFEDFETHYKKGLETTDYYEEDITLEEWYEQIEGYLEIRGTEWEWGET